MGESAAYLLRLSELFVRFYFLLLWLYAGFVLCTLYSRRPSIPLVGLLPSLNPAVVGGFLFLLFLRGVGSVALETCYSISSLCVASLPRASSLTLGLPPWRSPSLCVRQLCSLFPFSCLLSFLLPIFFAFHLLSQNCAFLSLPRLPSIPGSGGVRKCCPAILEALSGGWARTLASQAPVCTTWN